MFRKSYELGVKSVFESFEEEIKDYNGLHYENAKYLIDSVKKLYENELKGD